MASGSVLAFGLGLSPRRSEPGTPRETRILLEGSSGVSSQSPRKCGLERTGVIAVAGFAMISVTIAAAAELGRQVMGNHGLHSATQEWVWADAGESCLPDNAVTNAANFHNSDVLDFTFVRKSCKEDVKERLHSDTDTAVNNRIDRIEATTTSDPGMPGMGMRRLRDLSPSENLDEENRSEEKSWDTDALKAALEKVAVLDQALAERARPERELLDLDDVDEHALTTSLKAAKAAVREIQQAQAKKAAQESLEEAKAAKAEEEAAKLAAQNAARSAMLDAEKAAVLAAQKAAEAAVQRARHSREKGASDGHAADGEAGFEHTTKVEAPAPSAVQLSKEETSNVDAVEEPSAQSSPHEEASLASPSAGSRSMEGRGPTPIAATDAALRASTDTLRGKSQAVAAEKAAQIDAAKAELHARKQARTVAEAAKTIVTSANHLADNQDLSQDLSKVRCRTGLKCTSAPGARFGTCGGHKKGRIIKGIR